MAYVANLTPGQRAAVKHLSKLFTPVYLYADSLRYYIWNRLTRAFLHSTEANARVLCRTAAVHSTRNRKDEDKM